MNGATRYRSRTGLALNDYEQLLEAQHGGCAICGRPPRTRRLHVDHSHATGKIRGLLCFTCNRLVAVAGRLTDAHLDAARAYLKDGPRGDGKPWLT